MSIIVCLKVNDGVVLAADSAASIGGNRRIAKVYFNASKICNLRKPFPIGFAACGIGNIGNASLTTLAKDLRERFTSGDDRWVLRRGEYTIKDVVDRTREFFGDLLTSNPPPDSWTLECIVAGYSAREDFPRVYQLTWQGKKQDVTLEVAELWEKEPTGLASLGAHEVLQRLISGYSPRLVAILAEEMKVPAKQLSATLERILPKLQAPLFHAAMPIQDAIDLCYYLAKTVADFEHFTPGPQVVGGPIEVAAITKHEGFKWVRRKHYYSRELNPEVRE